MGQQLPVAVETDEPSSTDVTARNPAPAEADDSAEEKSAENESTNSKPAARVRAKRSITEVPSDPAASIREQTAMIDEARRQLRAGNPGGAVAELDRYHRKYKQGMFGQEAVMLRIEALSRSGNQSAARQLAQRFLASKPSSQYAKRIESLVGPIE